MSYSPVDYKSSASIALSVQLTLESASDCTDGRRTVRLLEA